MCGLGRSAVPSFLQPDAELIAPSDTTNRWDPSLKHRELTTAEVEHIVKQFGVSAAIAKKGGFDGIEVHAVHEGYLLDCFTMSLFNKRTDKYGGDLKGRLTFALEILEEIKKTCGKDFPVILRFSIKSYIKELRRGAVPEEKFEELGRDVDEALEAAKIFQEAGYQGFDADAGSYDSWYWAHPPMYFEKGMYLDLAKKLQAVSTVPVMVAGRMDDPDMTSNALAEGTIDMIGLGRPILADPEYINKIRNNKIETIRPCLGCHDGCFGRCLEGGSGSCAVNPECGREIITGIRKSNDIKKVVIIGGGPAGMEAARVASIRGHKVTLFEATDKLGGALKLGSVPKFKVDDKRLIKWYEHQMQLLNVNVLLNKKASKKDIDAENPDVVFVAEGSTAIVPKIEGIKKAVTAEDILSGKVAMKDNAVIIGGGLVGCELALHFAADGNKTTIIEGLNDILSSGKPLPPMNETMLRELLIFNKVSINAGRKLSKIKENSIEIISNSGTEEMKCTQVVLAIGYRSNNKIYNAIRNEYPEVYNIGDSQNVRNIKGAVWDAYEVARNI
ncbi:MAG: FAD-dependent oxidoreductase [Bacteroidetes bacterium]|nr:FAD-dependent oxidoreductase [Bacteroidota bacterium]